MKVTGDTIPVTELITAVKNSVKRAGVSRTASATGLRVATVQLILRVVASETTGGGLDIRVPVVGMRLRLSGKITRQDTHALDITLRPPAQDPGHELRSGSVEDALVDAINTIRALVASAAEGDDPWGLDAGTVDISFVVTRAGTLSLGIDGELSHEISHTLRLGLVAGPRS